jgi:hypothetical protein
MEGVTNDGVWGTSHGPGSAQWRHHDGGSPSSAASRSGEGARARTRRHGISSATVRTRRKRQTVADRSLGSAEPRSTVLSLEQEMIVAVRDHPLLPLDDCLCALQPLIPGLARWSLHFRPRRHGDRRTSSAASPPENGSRSARSASSTRSEPWPAAGPRTGASEEARTEENLAPPVRDHRSDLRARRRPALRRGHPTDCVPGLRGGADRGPLQAPHGPHRSSRQGRHRSKPNGEGSPGRPEQPRSRSPIISGLSRSDMNCEVNGIERRLAERDHACSEEDQPTARGTVGPTNGPGPSGRGPND